MTDHADVQVAHHGLILADLEMRVAQLAFLVLQNALDRPAGKADMQPGFESVFERVPDEEPLFLFGVQGIVSPEEMITAENATAATEPKRRRLDLPDHRPFVGILDVEGSPLLAQHRPAVMAKLLDATCLMARVVAGVVEPTVQIPRNFHDVAAVALFEAGDAVRLFSVPDVGPVPF